MVGGYSIGIAMYIGISYYVNFGSRSGMRGAFEKICYYLGVLSV